MANLKQSNVVHPNFPTNGSGGGGMDNRYVTHKEFDDAMIKIDKRFNEVDKQFVKIDSRFEVVDAKFDAVNSKLDTLN